MPRQVIHERKHHAPWHIRWTAPEFTVYEVTHASGRQTRWNQWRHVVGYLEKGTAGMSPVQPHRNKYPDHAAVIRHAAFPDTENNQRVIDKGAEVIHDRVTDTTTQYRAECKIKHQVADLCSTPLGTRPPRTHQAQPPAGAKGDQVHEAVPVYFERTNGQCDRADIGIGQHSIPCIIF